MKRIDIGCGRVPKPDYDAYTDIYMSSPVKDNPEVREKFVKTPLEDMSMFKDKEFDYAYCHHVIEHVNDPNKACSELIRIAKAGALYFPTVQADILFGRTDHNWLLFQVKPNHILFIKKRFPSYYGQGTKNLPEGVRPWTALQQPVFRWEGDFKWIVVL